ncbi:hypothetical protein HanRHA438_Chr14g0635521 [Helianthus annuus]|nr:hypothetical protein HanHA89_Chr14g0544091 [Helianthus annuus]KAJ0658707.1 hypothetical protein HanOQP8_Chr14g0511231 [Helianthus annuus]KAJ0838907.1 hypothetical protein HanPSC8_Chr14g0600301 [Helianthus annuus]KAJ0852211.1 hypothetical protein HanRHA438_Chr14g0635521 [Helianthus annuus]
MNLIQSVIVCSVLYDAPLYAVGGSDGPGSVVLKIMNCGKMMTKGQLLPFCDRKRRTLSNQILQIIKDEGASSTMHTLLVYLQNSPMEQQPVVASLLLQLDTLVEPWKTSIYREEAIDKLTDMLQKKRFPKFTTYGS